MEIKRGEVYYIDAGCAIGSEQRAGRPAIIVSNDLNNKHSSTVEVVYLTTQPKADLPTHTTIRSTSRTSTALCEQIHTVSIERVGDYQSSLTPQEMMNVDICLMISLGLEITHNAPTESEKPETDLDNRITAAELMIEGMKQKLLDASHTIVKLETERDVYKEIYMNLLEKMIEYTSV